MCLGCLFKKWSVSQRKIILLVLVTFYLSKWLIVTFGVFWIPCSLQHSTLPTIHDCSLSTPTGPANVDGSSSVDQF